MKYYGIYVAYPPTVDLRAQGLGRYLAAFVNGAGVRDDIRFVIVCPSWSKKSLREIFESEKVPAHAYSLLAPQSKFYILSCYEFFIRWRKKTTKTSSVRHFLKNKIYPFFNNVFQHSLRYIVQIRTPFFFLTPQFWLSLTILLIFILISPVLLLNKFVSEIRKNRLEQSFSKGTSNNDQKISNINHAQEIDVRSIPQTSINSSNNGTFSKIINKIRSIISTPKSSSIVLALFKQLEIAENELMQKLIQAQKDIQAWYIPTAFWPFCNQIQAPKLMCVPDVVLTDFPISFSQIGGDRFLSNFEAVQSSIQSGQYFVTYSDAVKWNTLVDRYAIAPEVITVVHHAPNQLNQHISLSINGKPPALSKGYSELLFLDALRKSNQVDYVKHIKNKSIKFLFYASQFRPNKNIITLLRAYEFLLRKGHIQHKLILTGNPKLYSPVNDYIIEHHLQNDVLCLSGLKVEELAACYYLADLAVNPSLSEGGCPFTFTEALSVNTPVVMARIPVTEEVLTDPKLQEMTFFDPYDWKSLAQRIQWALQHQNELLNVQQDVYAQLCKRTWTDVVNEHIEVLERIAQH